MRDIKIVEDTDYHYCISIDGIKTNLKFSKELIADFRGMFVLDLVSEFKIVVQQEIEMFGLNNKEQIKFDIMLDEWIGKLIER